MSHDKTNAIKSPVKATSSRTRAKTNTLRSPIETEKPGSPVKLNTPSSPIKTNTPRTPIKTNDRRSLTKINVLRSSANRIVDKSPNQTHHSLENPNSTRVNTRGSSKTQKTKVKGKKRNNGLKNKPAAPLTTSKSREKEETVSRPRKRHLQDQVNAVSSGCSSPVKNTNKAQSPPKIFKTASPPRKELPCGNCTHIGLLFTQFSFIVGFVCIWFSCLSRRIETLCSE